MPMFTWSVVYTAICVCVAVLFASQARAQEGLTGRIDERTPGISFAVPAGWTAYKTEVGYLIASETEKGFVLVMSHEFSSMSELENAARESMSDDNGTSLRPDREPERFLSAEYEGIAMYYKGTVEWVEARAYAVGLISPYGSGVTILAAVEPQSFTATFTSTVDDIARGVEFRQPELPPVDEQWKAALTGMRLTYMHTYSSGSSGGFSDRIVIDLCTDGSFSYSGSSNLSIDTGGAYGYSHGKSGGAGTWEVLNNGGQPVLRLIFNDGTVRQYRISLQDDRFYLDDTRYFRTHDAPCR